MKTIAAFSNQSGGIIVFGVCDRPRDLIGLTGPLLDEGIQSDLLKTSLVPHPITEFREASVHGIRVAVLQVSPLSNKPCIAAKDLTAGAGQPHMLRQGVIYARRRGQTAAISGSEFVQILQERDESIRHQIFGFLSRGRKVGFDRAIIADASSPGEAEGDVTYFLPYDAAKDLNVIDRANLVDDGGAPAYQIQGNIELTVPAANDPRQPMLPSRAADEIRHRVQQATLNDLPFNSTHLRKIAAHLGFWKTKEGDERHTGYQSMTERPFYFRDGREAVARFAEESPREFLEVCASAQNRARWQETGDAP
ncbi:Divergent AAA domain protein [Roseivivax jejudonensis]|uniref:Divergent AAA domain protein n=2 Tax=Roseivivax jejudonensis TaxID=1529041 RepID=A0A1X6ZEB9_9RHOB|nr:Divergent AAA domain protein [Roseivivax jejudonensis]